MTFMVHVRLGPMGVARSSVANSEQPGMVDSIYELYIARQGQPFQLAHRQDGLVVPRGQHWNASSGVNPDNVNDPGYGGNGWTAHDAHPQAEFGKIWLTPFHTNKDATEVTENASIWYDELIVSAQPIAAPGGSAAPATASVSLSASATSVNAGGSRDADLVVAERQLLHRLGRLDRKPDHERTAGGRAPERDHDLYPVLHRHQRIGVAVSHGERRVRHGRRVHRRRLDGRWLGDLQPAL